MLLPPGEQDVERVLDLVDGLVFAGGGDLDPALYGGPTHESIYMVDAERDRFELDLLAGALRRGHLPVLCICRGAQVLNVLRGGTLHTHLPEVVGEEILHRLPPRLPTRHPATVDGESQLARILGQTEVEVCSWHHQSVDKLGKGLRPVAWAADGVIEALELKDHLWCMAVQWHPEMQPGERPQERIFESFIAEIAAEHPTNL